MDGPLGKEEPALPRRIGVEVRWSQSTGTDRLFGGDSPKVSYSSRSVREQNASRTREEGIPTMLAQVRTETVNKSHRRARTETVQGVRWGCRGLSLPPQNARGRAVLSSRLNLLGQ